MSTLTLPPDGRGDAGRAAVVALFIVSTIIIVARVLTRFFVVKNPGFDDLFAFVAWLFNLGITTAFCFAVKAGLGLHMTQLPANGFTPLMKPLWVVVLMYNLCLYWTKVAMIAQLLRIFTDPTFRKITWAALVFTTLVSIFTVTASIIFCIPIAAYWDESITSSHCLPHFITFYTCAGLNVFNDIMILILPLPVLRGLNLPTKQKVALIGVFTLGFFVCVTSAIRLKKLSDVSDSTDISYEYVSVSVWSGIEASTGIICVSLPSLKATVTRYFPRLLMPLRSVHRGFSKHENGGSGGMGRLPGDAHKLESMDFEARAQMIPRTPQVVHKPSKGSIGVTTMISQEVRPSDGVDQYEQSTDSRTSDAERQLGLVQPDQPTRFA